MQQLELFDQMSELLREYEEQLAFLNAQWRSCPAGFLHVKKQHDGTFYSRVMNENGRKTEIPILPYAKENAQLLQELWMKRAVYHGRPILRKNIAALRTALSCLAPYDPEALLGDHRSILPDRFFLPQQLNAEKWIADTAAGRYRTNPFRHEYLRFASSDGHLVRSKSETLWCDMLAEIPLLYRYECALRLRSGRVLYPDFTVLHPAEKRLVYIEHFGKVDDPEYAMAQFRRLQEYADNGYVLGKDLFFTTETKEHPLTRDRIREVLRKSGLL